MSWADYGFPGNLRLVPVSTALEGLRLALNERLAAYGRPRSVSPFSAMAPVNVAVAALREYLGYSTWGYATPFYGASIPSPYTTNMFMAADDPISDLSWVGMSEAAWKADALSRFGVDLDNLPWMHDTCSVLLAMYRMINAIRYNGVQCNYTQQRQFTDENPGTTASGSGLSSLSAGWDGSYHVWNWPKTGQGTQPAVQMGTFVGCVATCTRNDFASQGVPYVAGTYYSAAAEYGFANFLSAYQPYVNLSPTGNTYSSVTMQYPMPIMDLSSTFSFFDP